MTNESGTLQRTDAGVGGRGPDVRALVRILVQKLCDLAADPGDSWPGLCEQHDVVLDVEVDGFRCLLIRQAEQAAATTAAQLSPRELEIARMVALGHPNKTIAAVLDISSWTVSSHLRRIFTKLGVGSRAAMVARLAGPALSNGSLSTPEEEAPVPAALPYRNPGAARADRRNI